MIEKVKISRLPIEDELVQKALDENQLVTGPHVVDFEKQIAKAFNFNYAISVSNGFSALFLAIRSLGLINSKIVVANHSTCWSMVNAVVSSGNIPVFCELDEGSLSLKESLLFKLVEESSIGAIIWPSHFGIPMQWETGQFCGIPIIEDACQAFHTRLTLGSGATLMVVSLYPTKFFNCIDGGIIFTNSEDLYWEISNIRYYDDQTTNDNKLRFNMRLPNLNAAIALVRLKAINKQLDNLRRVTERYKSVYNIYPAYFFADQFAPGVIPWRMLIRLNKVHLRGEIEKRGIPLSLELVDLNNTLDNSALNKNTVFALPFHEFLTDADLTYIITNLIDVLQES